MFVEIKCDVFVESLFFKLTVTLSPGQLRSFKVKMWLAGLNEILRIDELILRVIIFDERVQMRRWVKLGFD